MDFKAKTSNVLLVAASVFTISDCTFGVLGLLGSMLEKKTCCKNFCWSSDDHFSHLFDFSWTELLIIKEICKLNEIIHFISSPKERTSIHITATKCAAKWFYFSFSFTNAVMSSFYTNHSQYNERKKQVFLLLLHLIPILKALLLRNKKLPLSHLWASLMSQSGWKLKRS